MVPKKTAQEFAFRGWNLGFWVSGLPQRALSMQIPWRIQDRSLPEAQLAGKPTLGFRVQGLGFRG